MTTRRGSWATGRSTCSHPRWTPPASPARGQRGRQCTQKTPSAGGCVCEALLGLKFVLGNCNESVDLLLYLVGFYFIETWDALFMIQNVVFVDFSWAAPHSSPLPFLFGGLSDLGVGLACLFVCLFVCLFIYLCLAWLYLACLFV